MKSTIKFFRPHEHLSTDALHYALIRQLEDLDSEGIVDSGSVHVLHGDELESLRKIDKTYSRNETRSFYKITSMDYIAIPFIADGHINLSLLHRSESGDVLYITDSLKSDESRYDRILEVAATLLAINDQYTDIKVQKLKAASQGTNLDDCGIYSVIFLSRIFDFINDKDSHALKDVNQDEVDALRRQLERDFLKASTLDQPPEGVLKQTEKKSEPENKKETKAGPAAKKQKKRANVESSDSDQGDEVKQQPDKAGTSKSMSRGRQRVQDAQPSKEVMELYEERLRLKAPIPKLPPTTLEDLKAITALEVAKDAVGKCHYCFYSCC